MIDIDAYERDVRDLDFRYERAKTRILSSFQRGTSAEWRQLRKRTLKACWKRRRFWVACAYGLFEAAL